ncbi:DUF7503 family protein [Natronococcus occultus]|uniref:Uncharacterized protein n=1 Tax=Natronococcus occultus SP4 TaxID=694430 RepID=L0K527_9EURY|nr:hypothetical protein [Natronococcus occultus]AGB39218.1 hypothetical protein Natoc_3491 [Natronococcus occultus SP4]
MSSNDKTLRTFLTEHPRLLGVLFAGCLLLSQVGTAAADLGIAGNGGGTW